MRYYSKDGLGTAGEPSHWMTEVSEGTREWKRAVRYCQAQAQNTDLNGGSAAHSTAGCATIQVLAESGY